MRVCPGVAIVCWLTVCVVGGARNPGLHWKRRGHRGEEEDTEEDLTKELDDSSAGASVDEGSGSKNGNLPDRKCE